MRECCRFWFRSGGCIVSTREIVDVLSITGGVPKYLENIVPTATADENIAEMCFSQGGLLVEEFDEIFNDVLDENLGFKKKLLLALADGSKSPMELADALGIERGGAVTSNLEGLEAAGFIAKDEGYNPVSGKRSNLVRYRISDNYTRFYLKYIEPQRSLIAKGAYRFISVEHLPGWSSILGLQFEALVANNLLTMMQLLSLDKTLLLSAAPYHQGETARAKGCQIDLLMQTRHTAYAVEIKRRDKIGEEVVSEMQEKLRRLKVRHGMSVVPVLVYEGRISKRIEADGFFAHMISADRLIGRD